MKSEKVRLFMATFSVNMPRGNFQIKLKKWLNFQTSGKFQWPTANLSQSTSQCRWQKYYISYLKFNQVFFVFPSLNKATLQLKEKQHFRNTIPLCFQEKQHRKKCLLPDEGQDEGECAKDKNKNSEKDKKLFAHPTFYLSCFCGCESQTFVSHLLFSLQFLAIKQLYCGYCLLKLSAIHNSKRSLG